MNSETLPRKTQAKPATKTGDPSGSTDPESWVEKHGDELFGFAMSRVRDRSAAQDLVQETFLAALRARANFAGRSSERGWLFGILRKKLVDYYRQKGRDAIFAEVDCSGPEEDKFFQTKGFRKDAWIASLAPQRWTGPEESLIEKEFQEVFHRCLARLPDKTAQVFILREVDGLASEQICKDSNVSANNFWVMLHRARMGLRRCLELHWFGRKRMSNEKD